MQSRKKVLSALLLVLLIPALAPAVNAAEITWSPDTPLITNPEANDWNGQIIQADGTIWVVWSSNRTGNYEIFCTNSSDDGVSWSNDTRLTTYQYKDDYPSIMQTANGTIWVVWTREIMTPDYHWDIYYRTSSDGGATWSDEEPFITDPNFDLAPSIIQTADSKIWVVWQSDRIWVWDPIELEWIPQDDIYYKTSTDGGGTWSNDTRLTTKMIIVNETAEETTIVDDIDPSITQTADDKIWIVWVSNRYTNRDLFYKTSSDGGATWSNETQQLTTHVSDDWAPSITQSADGYTWVVWHSAREAKYDIFYKTSSDGVTWSGDTRLTTDPDHDMGPSITQTADDEIWIMWASDRAVNCDIWYTTLVVVHDVAVLNITPSSTLAYLGTTINITVEVKNKGSLKETFNVTAYTTTAIIGTQTATELAPNATATLTFNWNITETFLGNLTVSATADRVKGETDLTDNSLSDGTIEIRIPGDVDGDDYVGPHDHWLFGGAYGTHFGEPYYDPYCDFDGDGYVGPDDHWLFSGNYGTIVIRDVAITNITLPSTPIYQGNQVNIIVDVKNWGTISETFNVTIHANSTPIGTQTVTNLAPNASTTLAFTWNTTSTSPGNYTMSATAGPVPNEKDLTDNSLSDGTIEIRIPGDVDGDDYVGPDDHWLFCRAFYSHLGEPYYDPYCDFDGDGYVGPNDHWMLAGNYGEST